jgi:hypothetical protein
MNLTPDQPLDVPVRTADASRSPWSRAVAIFARPHQAWSGLERRAQWWFPILVAVVVSAATLLATYDRVMLPTVLEPMEKQLADGQMSQIQFDHAEAFFSSPLGRLVNVGIQVLGVFVSTLLVALVVWFGGAFLLGRRFGYRLALEVAAWAGLVTVPGSLLASAIAYVREASLRSVHLGFGALLPEAEPPSRALTGLTVFLDAVGPLGIWFVAVVVLGVSALSGAPRRPAVWVVSGLYLGLAVLGAALAAVFAPGS